jgi:hypothetical protein
MLSPLPSSRVYKGRNLYGSGERGTYDKAAGEVWQFAKDHLVLVSVVALGGFGSFNAVGNGGVEFWRVGSNRRHGTLFCRVLFSCV